MQDVHTADAIKEKLDRMRTTDADAINADLLAFIKS